MPHLDLDVTGHSCIVQSALPMLTLAFVFLMCAAAAAETETVPHRRPCLLPDSEKQHWTNDSIAVLQMMGQGYGHQHADKLMILMHAGGRLLYPDFDPIQYESANVNWTRSTIAHNTLVVDRGNTQDSPSSCRHDFAPEVKFLATTASCYEGVQQTRALALTREYLLDLFRADSAVRTRTTGCCTQSGGCNGNILRSTSLRTT